MEPDLDSWTKNSALIPAITMPLLGHLENVERTLKKIQTAQFSFSLLTKERDKTVKSHLKIFFDQRPKENNSLL